MSAPAAPPIGTLRGAERGAVLGFAIGTVAMTATFGLRTAFFQPDYWVDALQLRVLAIQAAPELLIALAMGALALWSRRERVSKVVLIVLTVMLVGAKGVLIAFQEMLREPDPWAVSPATQTLCAIVNIPLALSFFAVLAAIFTARGVPGVEKGSPAEPPAIDLTLEVRAALTVWLATVGLGTVALGPDRLVRLVGSVALAAALVHYLRGRREEKALFDWARRAVHQGPPAHVVQEETPPHEVPSLYAGHARTATIYAIDQAGGSYRQGPTRQPVAAISPNALLVFRPFSKRVTRRLSVPVAYSLMAIVLSWPLLHSSELPPRPVTERFDREPVKQYTDESVPGLTLWLVRRGPTGNLLVGYDPATHEVVEAEKLLARFQDKSVEDLARLAHKIIANGDGTLLSGSDPGWAKDQEGQQPRAPFVEKGMLHFWVSYQGKPSHIEVKVQESSLLPGSYQ